MDLGTRIEGGRAPVRRLSFGAEPGRDGVHFRVWAPVARHVEALVEGVGEGAYPLAPEGDGWYSGVAPGLRAGARYRYRLDGGEALADPASRFQPEGPHGPSEVVDPGAFRWGDEAWPGLAPDGQILYELHVGTFTSEGTWDAAARELPRLADLGVTAVEVLPVADFTGRFGWGYDGVDLYAPSRLYGTPDDLRRFVDRAHAHGLGVVLDVVYNHLGPDGCTLPRFAPQVFTDRYDGEWGDPLNYDGEDAGPVRAFVVENAGYWISEFHLDGLRIDATQGIFDASPVHVLAELTARARRAAGRRSVVLVAENEPQDTRIVRPREEGGYGLDLAWNDDFHHATHVALTGRREGYYSDYGGTPQELVSAAKRGYLFQGQRYAWQRKRRGTSTRGLPPRSFVAYLENHDQVANSAGGARLSALASPGRLRAMTALLLLGPWTPMLFQGQEFASSRPFLYFADHAGELAGKVRRGRVEFLRQFASLAGADMRDQMPDPCTLETFEACKLDPAERDRHRAAVALHRDLLGLRRTDPVLAAQAGGGLDGAVLAQETFCLRWFAPDGRDRVLVVNLGAERDVASVSEPLLAPPDARGWRVVWSSEDPRYGGGGTPDVRDGERLRVAGHAALLLAPAEGDDA